MATNTERGLWVLTECFVFGILGVHAGALGAEVPRQSIPNLAVKLYSGDNTVGAALWKDSSVPAANKNQSGKTMIILVTLKRY